MSKTWIISFLCVVQVCSAGAGDYHDDASMVQRTVQEDGLHKYSDAQLAALNKRAILFDHRKQKFFASMLSKVTHMLHFGGKKSVLAWLEKTTEEAKTTCAKGPGLGLVGFGMDMPNSISSLLGCKGNSTWDGLCLTKEILGGVLSPIMDLAMDIYNIEQDCGCPFLQGLKDCEEDTNQGYYGATPKEKNNFTTKVKTVSTIMAAYAGIYGAVTTCQAKNGSKQAPMHPVALIPLPAAQASFSIYEFHKLRQFLIKEKAENKSTGDSDGTCEIVSGVSAIASDVGGFVTAVLDTVSHYKYDEKTKPNAGWEELCASEILGAIDAIPAMADVFCSWKSCEDGFPKGALRSFTYGTDEHNGGKCGDTEDEAPAPAAQ